MDATSWARTADKKPRTVFMAKSALDTQCILNKNDVLAGGAAV